VEVWFEDTGPSEGPVLFFVYGLELHYQSSEKAPWSKPSALEEQTGFIDTARR
jgi:hypothetical protein